MKSGKKFILTEKILNHAWQLKNHGFTDAKIAEALKVSSATYSLHKLQFLVYFARKVRERREETEGTPRFQERLDKYRIAAVKLAEIGEDQRKISAQLGIPEATLRYWMEMDETFGHAIRSAKDNADERVIRALLRRCEGFTTREATTTEMTMGNTITQRTTTRRVSRVLPNTKAIELWLTNRRKWLSENQQDTNPTGDNRAIEYEIIDNLFNAEDNARQKENI